MLSRCHLPPPGRTSKRLEIPAPTCLMRELYIRDHPGYAPETLMDRLLKVSLKCRFDEVFQENRNLSLGKKLAIYSTTKVNMTWTWENIPRFFQTPRQEGIWKYTVREVSLYCIPNNARWRALAFSIESQVTRFAIAWCIFPDKKKRTQQTILQHIEYIVL